MAKLTKAKKLKDLKIGDVVNVVGQFSSGFIHPHTDTITRLVHRKIEKTVFYKDGKGVVNYGTVTIHCGEDVFKGGAEKSQAIAIKGPKAYMIEL